MTLSDQIIPIIAAGDRLRGPLPVIAGTCLSLCPCSAEDCRPGEWWADLNMGLFGFRVTRWMSGLASLQSRKEHVHKTSSDGEHSDSEQNMLHHDKVNRKSCSNTGK